MLNRNAKMLIISLTAKSFLSVYVKYIAPPLILMVVWLTRSHPDWYGYAYPFGCKGHIVNELQITESSLLKIRKNKKPVPWKRFTGIPLAWQLQAMSRQDGLALELFFIETVWASRGSNYARYRLEKSSLKKELGSRYTFTAKLLKETILRKVSST